MFLIFLFFYSSVNKYGDISPRTGFFHWFEESDIVVKNYDKFTEDLYDGMR